MTKRQIVKSGKKTIRNADFIRKPSETIVLYGREKTYHPISTAVSAAANQTLICHCLALSLARAKSAGYYFFGPTQRHTHTQARVINLY